MRYQGLNETVLIHDGHLTWRYWLRRVQHVEIGKTKPALQDGVSIPPTGNDGQAEVFTSEEHGADSVPRNLPCRVSIEIRGIEWYVYNRSAAYDAILGKIASETVSKNADTNCNGRTTSISKPSFTKEVTTSETREDGSPHKTEDQNLPPLHGSLDVKLEEAGSISSKNSLSNSTNLRGRDETWALPSLLSILPVKIECSKGAFVMGNQNTRSILVAKFDNAIGQLGARNARPIDKYKQLIDFDFSHPVIQFKKNQDFKESQIAEGARHISKDSVKKVSSKFQYSRSVISQQIRNAWSTFCGVILPLRDPVGSLIDDRTNIVNASPATEYDTGVQSRWLGLTRYLDEDDELAEQERWKAIEYGRFPTILDSPKVAINIYWDVPGVLRMPERDSSQAYSKWADDINREVPPDWGVDIRVFGGNIRYGPWADRQRADLQAIFFPSLYKDSIPEEKMVPGQPRVSTVFKLVIEIEEYVTLGIPTREESKDWKWKGRENGQDKANMRPKDKRAHAKQKKNAKADITPESRSCGWLDVKLFPDSTISLTMDLVARGHGFNNRIELDIPQMEISTSVNHGLLLRSNSQRISCDLFYPLKWNEVHPWRVELHTVNPEIFLLRDHIFLLTDLISDWVSGPPSNFHTFVPFEYAINFQLNDFKIYLNANDRNIINSPADMKDNIFTMVYGKDLSATLNIPLNNFRPPRIQVSFDVKASDGGMDVFTPQWNTYHTFLENSQIARMRDLHVYGAYDYFTSTRPGLTDILNLNIDGSALKLHLYGFFVRYLITLKDNYFGEDLHFRTVEEYQTQHAQQERSNETGPHSRLTNDLDVIMAITVKEPCILLPTHIYSVSENIFLEMSSIDLDLRFTNFYMDLAVTLSPISISHSKISSHPEALGEQHSGIQVFIDGVEITSHRLFGLPPAEPTYVCNWDFVVGSITGECSDESLESLLRMLRSFTFSFADSENALAGIQIQEIHDLTFLRARIKPINIWLRLQGLAFLFSSDEIKICYNDLRGHLFSEQLSILAPRLTIACMMNASESMGERRSITAVAPSAYITTAIDAKMMKQLQNFTLNRQLQQIHITQHDSRTHRVPWLIQTLEQPPLLNSAGHPSKYRAPAIPIPPMPGPILEVYNSTSDCLTTSSTSFPISTRKTAFRRASSFLSTCSARQVRAKRSRPSLASLGHSDKLEKKDCHPCSSPPTGQDSGTISGPPKLTFSSPYRRPHFPLIGTRLDLTAVPVLPLNVPVDVAGSVSGPLEASKILSLDQGLQRSSYIIHMPNGLRAFCRSESILEMGSVIMQRRKADPVTLLDALQVSVTREDTLMTAGSERAKNVIELRLLLPCMEARMTGARAVQDGPGSQQVHLGFGLQRLLVTGRSSESHINDNSLPSSQLSLHVSLDQASCSTRTAEDISPAKKATMEAVVYDIILWTVSSPIQAVNMQFKILDVTTQGSNADALATLLQQTLELGQASKESLSLIKGTTTQPMQSLVLFLSVNGDKIRDPPFVATASYVLRCTASHPRTFDSWKMISRLRYIYQSLEDGLKDQATMQCMQGSSMSPEDASKRVFQSFEKRRTWDVAQVRQNRLMEEVFGQRENSVDKRSTTRPPLKVVFRAGKMRFRVDPLIGTNEIILEQFIFGMTTKQPWQERLVSGSMAHMKHSNLEMHCGKATMQISGNMIEYLEAILESFEALPRKDSTNLDVKPSIKPLHAIHRLHIVVSFDSIILSLHTTNLETISVFNGLNASVIVHPSLDDEAFTYNAVINNQTVTTRLYSKTQLVTSLRLTGSSLTGSMDGPVSESESSVLYFTGSCADFYFEVPEKPLEILNLADRLLGEEIADCVGLVKKVQSRSDRQKPSISSSGQHSTLKIHVFLALGLYSMSFAILPSLTYLISGKGFQALLLPAKDVNSEIAMDFDLKNHSHLIRKQFQELPDNISTLDIPPIYGRLTLRSGSNSNSGTFHATVEKITLDASSVHAFVDALSHQEIAKLSSIFTQEIPLLQRHYQDQFPAAPEHHSTLQPREPGIYAGYVTLAGLVIRTNVLKSVTAAQGVQLQLDMGRMQLKATNKSLALGRVLDTPDVDIKFRGIKLELVQFKTSNPNPCGGITLGLGLKSTSEMNSNNELIRAYQISSHNLSVHIYSETATILLEIISHLQDTLKTIDVAKEVRGLRRLTLARLQSEGFALNTKRVDKQTQNDMNLPTTLNARYSLRMVESKLVWKIGAHTPGREAEDLVLSFTKIDLATKKDKAARLLIQDFQLQMVPASMVSAGRSVNSALLPEVVFNVAYVSTATDRRLAFQAAGKSLDLCLTSDFILPASDLRRSIAIAVADIRKAIVSWNASTSEGTSPRKRPLGKKRLASLLIDADFAGAVVHIQSRKVPGPSSLASGLPRRGPVPQHGRYGQFTHDSAISSTTLRAPGIALKFEYKDIDDNEPSLSAEFKVDASSNVLYPTVVPLIMEISSSIKEVVGESDNQAESKESKPVAPELMDDQELSTAVSTTIFGKCRLNLGLRICRQEFSLSCHPIARVSATAHFEAIYITISTLHSTDQEQVFALSATFNHLLVSLQHDYSRESTGSFEVDQVFLSMMSSKHAGVANGLSAILKSSPIKALINAKQSHDFLLFREIWVPREIRHHPSVTAKPTSESQAFMVQHYQQVAAAGIFPWDATVSIAKLEVQLDLGQSLGKSTFAISDIWISSKKSSDWEQNLCLGFQHASVDATGRMSGFVKLENLQVRTSIHWTAMAQKQSRAPLIQASLGFDRLRVKAAFDFEAFLIADVTTFKFLMYNIRDGRQAVGDHLVGVVESGKVQLFCTSTSASQGLALYQAFERLIQEKRAAYETSLKDIEKFLYRQPPTSLPSTSTVPKREEGIKPEVKTTAPLQLQTNVVVTLGAINLGVFPSTFFDNQILKLEALDASARFGAVTENDKLHSSLGMILGQLRVALSGVSKTTGPRTVREMLVEEIVASAAESRGGTILKVPRLVATMQTWQAPQLNHIDYIFGSSFQGKVDVGWNYSRISFLRGMWAAHARALAQRWGKPLPPSALQITGGLQPEDDDEGNSRRASGPAKITAVVNVPQSKFQYTALEPPVIETPQLRDMGEATPPLEWIGLQRERLPTLTHQIVIVSLLEVAKEVEDAYQRILGSF